MVLSRQIRGSTDSVTHGRAPKGDNDILQIFALQGYNTAYGEINRRFLKC